MDLESRVSKLEARIEHIEASVSEIKVELKKLRRDMKRYYRWLLGITGGGYIIILIVLAYGFHWI